MANILITGASAGIGRAAAILLANKGHTVIGTGRDPEALSDLAARAPQVHALAMDVSDADSVAAAVAQVNDILGGAPLDVLVNNAGYGCAGPLELLSDADIEAQYQVNVFGLLRVTRAFLPAMRERGSGRIVNVSSVAGDVTAPFFGAYASSKHAVESLSDALRSELRPHGIKVVLVKPGAVKTRFGEREREQLQRHADSSPAYRGQIETFLRFHRRLHADGADPVSVAGTVAIACESPSPRPRYVTPWFKNSLFIVLRRWLPTSAGDWLLRRLTGLDRA
jgi:NAD(P)-dependent dehydrogenase (short-subunit alcohol dehydrogenase family)